MANVLQVGVLMALSSEASGWMDLAACAGHSDPEIFHDIDRQGEGLAVCQVCPVQAPCRDFQNRYKYSGVWGGRPVFSPAERREAMLRNL